MGCCERATAGSAWGFGFDLVAGVCVGVDAFCARRVAWLKEIAVRKIARQVKRRVEKDI